MKHSISSNVHKLMCVFASLLSEGNTILLKKAKARKARWNKYLSKLGTIT